jgi:hypothetical protein
MRQVLDSFNLRIDRKTYYNLIRSKPLKDGISNNSFKDLIFTLKEVGFRFTCLISDELIENGVEQAWSAAAKHSTRRTTSVKKCVNSI